MVLGLESLMQSYPLVSLIIISIVVTFFSSLITKLFTNQNRMNELKAVQKACQIRMKDAKGDMKKIAEIQKEMMGCSAEMMKMSFKPLLITFIPFILIFTFLRNIYTTTEIAKTWIWWYIGVSIASSFFIRKILKM